MQRDRRHHRLPPDRDPLASWRPVELVYRRTRPLLHRWRRGRPLWSARSALCPLWNLHRHQRSTTQQSLKRNVRPAPQQTSLIAQKLVQRCFIHSASPARGGTRACGRILHGRHSTRKVHLARAQLSRIYQHTSNVTRSAARAPPNDGTAHEALRPRAFPAGR